ncbi:MAG: acetylglutamate kinase [Bacteroidales bacterium]|nr:acetylglutamate kinase [Bacteroidales bacterium]
MKELTVIKIGGNIVDNEAALDAVLAKVANIKTPKILIHGGGVMASQMSAKLGIETKMVEGRRITDYETLRIVTMVYAGWINKTIVAKLQKIGCNAIGLSGADANVVPAKRRPAQPIDFGYVGDVEYPQINAPFIETLLEKGITPVFCAITHDTNGSLLNTNADTMASSIASAMSRNLCVKLVYCFEKDGVLYDKDDDSSVIPLITEQKFLELKECGKIDGGMIPKLTNAFKALKNGVSEVYIKHAKNLDNNLHTLIKK